MPSVEVVDHEYRCKRCGTHYVVGALALAEGSYEGKTDHNHSCEDDATGVGEFVGWVNRRTVSCKKDYGSANWWSYHFNELYIGFVLIQHEKEVQNG